MPGDISISVIIPTYNGAHKVVNALESLCRQTIAPDEVLVVIDGSTDNTREAIAQLPVKPAGLKVIEQANQGRAGVRNTGARNAQHELLLFLDDDMMVPEGFVAAHIAHHRKFPGSLVSGRLDQVMPDQAQQTEFDIFEQWQNGRWNKEVTAHAADEVLLDTAYITANNFSISRKDFMELGLFDDRLKDAEDYDLAVRAKLAGKALYLSNACWAWHNDFTGKNFMSYLKRLREYNKSQWALIRLKPELHGDPAVNPRYPAVPVGVKAWFFKFFVNGYFIRTLERGTWRFLPVAARCKLYDFILTANGVYFPTVNLPLR